MAEPILGKLVRVDPKTVWSHEARDFTPWLAKHLSLLNEALALDIELTGTEMAVGSFAVDIFGKDLSSGHEVIIENQLLATDHSHLGQLLTYAAGLDAKIVIWISPQFRDEHKQALDWLNRQSPETVSFFGVELHVFRIEPTEESAAPNAVCPLQAPHFEVVAQPSQWQEEIVTAARGIATEKGAAYHEFFTDLLNRLKDTHPGFTAVKQAGYNNWIAFASGKAGFILTVEFGRPNQFRVQLFIDTGSRDSSKLAFDRLVSQKESIESELGEPLEWLRLDDKRACRMFLLRQGTIGSPPEVLEELKQWAVDELPRFKRIFGQRLKDLDLTDLSHGELGP